MADRSYIIEVLLEAKDNMSRAFAEATGQIEAYNKLLDAEKAKTEAATRANQGYAREFERGDSALKQRNRAMSDLNLKSEEAVDKLVDLENAQRKVTRAQEEGKGGTAEYVQLINRLRTAQEAYATALKEIEGRSHQLATAESETARQRVAASERVRLTVIREGKSQEEAAKAAEKRYRDDIANQRAASQAADAINRETERSQKDSWARIDAEERQRQQRRLQESRQMAQERRAAEQAAAGQERRFASIVGRAEGPARTLARTDISQAQEIEATRRLATARDELVQSGLRVAEADTAIHNIRQDALSDFGHENQAARDAAKIERDYAEALRMVETAAKRVETAKRSASRGGTGEVPRDVANVGSTNVVRDVEKVGTDAQQGQGLLGWLSSAKNSFADLDTSTSGFNTHFRSAFGFAAIALLQPLLALVLGLVGAMGALASAAVAAGGALGGLFATAGAQGLPALGLVAAAMQRLGAIVGYAAAQHQQLQQRFMAQYITARQNALGINQVAIAQHNYQQALIGVQSAQFGVIQSEHSYSNALFAQQQAVRNVGIATLQLRETRLQATRQLQDLIFQETQAKLAAEASSLAVTDAQKALQATIATGGDVQAAQLNLQQAQAQHVQATTGAQRAITDAARGSLARQGISEQVSQAQNAVVEARRAVTDANFSVRAAAVAIQNARQSVAQAEYGAQQARAAIALAQQQASGYSIQTNAQLAYLRSQMTATEIALSKNVQRIYNLFQGAGGALRPFTDAILKPFIGLTGRILQILKDPQFTGAIQNLANAIGTQFDRVWKVIFSDQSIKAFETIINQAAANIRPLATIAISFFQAVGSIVKAAAPFVHTFVEDLAAAATHFSNWAKSSAGQTWLKDFFSEGFKALQAFMNLGVAFARLILTVVTAGGGAKAGIGILQSLTSWADRTTTSIVNHKKAWTDLQTLWQSIRPALSALGEILGALGHAFMQIGGTPQGQRALKSLADIISRDIIPGVTKAFLWIGKLTDEFLKFVRAHPIVGQIAKDLIAVGVAGSIAGKAIGLIFGPLSAIIGISGKVIGLFKFLGSEEGLSAAAKGAEKFGGAIMGAFSNPIIAGIALAAAAIVGLAAATGNLGNLSKAVVGPFVSAFNQLKPTFKDLLRDVTQFFAALGFHTKNAHDDVKVLVDIVGFLASAISRVLVGAVRIWGAIWGTTIRVATGFISALKGVITGFIDFFSNLGNWGKMWSAIKEIGKGILNGIKTAIITIPKILVEEFIKMVDAVLKFLGIASPSKKFFDIAKQIVLGLVNGFAGLAGNVLHSVTSAFGAVLSWLGGLPSKLGSLAGKAASALVGAFGGVGEKIINAVISTGIHAFDFGKQLVKSLAKLIDKAIPDVIHMPDPLPNIDLPKNPLHSLGFYQQGGPIGSGYGGGDRRPAMLEDGEHVLTKEEVRSAGGHGVIFALRAILGGGGQGTGGRFAVGGAVQAPANVPQGVVGSGQARSQDYQGVHGTLGGDLANVQNFSKQFQLDWLAMWTAIEKETVTAIDYLEKQYGKFIQNTTDQFNTLRNKLGDTWNNINNQSRDAGNKLYANMAAVLTKFDNAIFNAFWYVQHATNQSLKAFQAKPVDVTLGAIPKFSGGGMVGKTGERGRDAVHALLGRGEAVLNWAHQKVVDPALRAVYGFGLGEMFQKIRGEHGPAAESGYAAGGYVFPFSGSGWGWSRTDQGVDFYGNAPIGAIGNATVTYSNPNDGWYAPAPAFMVYRLDDGKDAGKYIYVAEHITRMAPSGTKIRAGHAVAQMVGGIETGWAAGPQGHQIIMPMGADHHTAAGQAFHDFLIGLQHGKIVGGGFGGAGATWNRVKELAVHGSGVLKELAQAAIKKVTGAANAYGEKQAGSAMGGTIGNVVGNILHLAQVAAKFAGVPWDAQIVRELLTKESSGGQNLPPHFYGGALDPAGPFQVISSTFKSYEVPGHTNRMNPFDNALAAFRYIKSRYGTLQSLASTTGLFGAGYKGYREGGFAGGIPIVAHAGEWIVNKAQQMKIASHMGKTVEGLKESLGFTGGPIHYQGGGAPGDQHETDRGTDRIVAAVAGFQEDFKRAHREAQQWRHRSGGQRDRQIATPPSMDSAYTGSASPTGVFTAPTASLDQLAIYLARARVYEQAQRTTERKLIDHAKKFDKGIQQYLDNFNKISGDNGLFAQAANAVQDFVTSQQNMISLAASGVRMIGQRLKFGGRALDPVGVAREGLRSTNRIIDQLRALQGSEQTAYARNEAEIRKVQAAPQTDKTRKQLQELLGAREEMTKRLRDTDGQLAQSLSDRYDKTAELFQAQTDRALRGGRTLSGGDVSKIIGSGGISGLLGKVGPAIASGLAQMAQTLAQTLGDPAAMQAADREVLNAAVGTRDELAKRYKAAAEKAKTDPRWQKTADDLLTQLESATESVAQAQAQALTDAIQAQDTRGQMQSAAIDVRNRLFAVQAAAGDQLGAAQGQITLSQYNAAGLRSQLSSYQGLYATAQAEGNVQAMNDLGNKIGDLTAQVAEADQQTQNLITAFHQLQITMLQTRAQAASGLFGSAASIFQTIGQITGSLSLPELIANAQALGEELRNEGGIIADAIISAMSDPKTFGKFSAQVDAILGPLMDAFNQGPAAFAAALTKFAPAIAALEATMGEGPQRDDFVALISSMVDNTTATVTNTENLQQLNATTNQQQFTSSAWTMFREAIFNGIGGLLPQFAMAVPSMDVGGMISSSGLLVGHKNEVILPASVTKGALPKMSRGDVNVNVTNPTEVADPVYLGNEIAWRLEHNPNSR